jgi:hypothetical protein
MEFLSVLEVRTRPCQKHLFQSSIQVKTLSATEDVSSTMFSINKMPLSFDVLSQLLFSNQHSNIHSRQGWNRQCQSAMARSNQVSVPCSLNHDDWLLINGEDGCTMMVIK